MPVVLTAEVKVTVLLDRVVRDTRGFSLVLEISRSIDVSLLIVVFIKSELYFRMMII